MDTGYTLHLSLQELIIKSIRLRLLAMLYMYNGFSSLITSSVSDLNIKIT